MFSSRLSITPPAKATLSPQLIFPRRPWVRLQQSQTLRSNHIPSLCVCEIYTLTCHLPAHWNSWWAAPSISSDARCHTSGAAGGGRTWCPAGSQAGHGAIHAHKPQHRESEMGTHRLGSCFRHRILLCFIALRVTLKSPSEISFCTVTHKPLPPWCTCKGQKWMFQKATTHPVDAPEYAAYSPLWDVIFLCLHYW